MNPEPNTPSEDPLPDSGADPLRHPRVQALEQAIVAFGHRQRATRRFAQIAIGVAVLGFLFALWVESRSKDRVVAIRTLKAEVEDVRAELRRVKAERTRFTPDSREHDPPPPTPETVFDPSGSTELDALRSRLTAVEIKSERNSQDLTSGLVDWGTETKSYVDRSITTAAEERRRETGQDFSLVWDRIRQIELRLPR